MKSKSRKHRGGMQGFGYAPGAALLPGVQIDAQMRVPYDSCMTVDRPGQQAFSNLGGLPGMKGGGNCGRLVRGGRYSVDVGSPMVPGLAEITKMPCDRPLYSQTGGVGLTGSAHAPILEESTARYTTGPSPWVGGTGAPVLLNQALDQTAWSKACTQTAGRRGSGGKKSQQKRKTRRTMKKRSTKKSRSRRHR